MLARNKTWIGIALVVTVAVLFVSTCVPMPKSVLKQHAHQVAASIYIAQVLGPVLLPAIDRGQLGSSPVFAESGTDLINRICSRIC